LLQTNLVLGPARYVSRQRRRSSISPLQASDSPTSWIARSSSICSFCSFRRPARQGVDYPWLPIGHS